MRKGLPAKYAKHGFKRGWAMYKAAKRKYKTRGSSPAKRASRPTTRTTGATTMATTVKRRRPVRRAMGASPVRRRRRAPRLLSQATLNTVMDGFLIGGSAIGSTMAMGMIPVIKDQRAWIKSLSQAALGIVMLSVFKDRYIKKASMGVIVGSGMSLILPMLPEGMRVFGRRSFSATELHKLQTLGKPYGIPRTSGPVYLGKPMSLQTAQAANSPMTLGRTSNRASRYR